MGQQPLIRFPIFLLTQGSEVDVSKLKVGRFKEGRDWATAPIDGKRALLAFSSPKNAHRFVAALDSRGPELIALELDRADAIEALAEMEREIPLLSMDHGSPSARHAPLAPMLSYIRSLPV